MGSHVRRFGDAGSRVPTRRQRTLAVRTYRRIAEILVERGSTAMTPALVARICREAEMKILHALRDDLAVGEQPSAEKTWDLRPRWRQS